MIVRDEIQLKGFYCSHEWAELRYKTLVDRGARCECCGASPPSGAVMRVDHIKPLRKFWHLRLDPKNMQVLCNSCNRGKGHWDQTDWRPEYATDTDYPDIAIGAVATEIPPVVIPRSPQEIEARRLAKAKRREKLKLKRARRALKKAKQAAATEMRERA